MEMCHIRETDIDAVTNIDNVSFSLPWSRESFLDELSCNYSTCSLVKNDDSVIAYICFRVIIDEMEILRIAVDPKWRGMGIASILLSASLNTAAQKGAKLSLLEVRPSNISAVMLYQKFGFMAVGKRIGYYSETGEDALILMKHLN